MPGICLDDLYSIFHTQQVKLACRCSPQDAIESNLGRNFLQHPKKTTNPVKLEDCRLNINKGARDLR